MMAEIDRVNGMLQNKNFTEKAPKAKVDAEMDKLLKFTPMLEKVRERLEQLNKSKRIEIFG